LADKISRSVNTDPAFLNKPRFNINTVKRLRQQLTYRTINEWETRGLISPHRTTKGVGWRKFSAMDVIRLFIISDLKTFGFSNGEIRKILSRVSPNGRQDRYSTRLLDNCVGESLSYKTRFLLFILERTTPRFIKETDDWKDILSHGKTYKHPTVILPVADYIVKLSDSNILCVEAKQKA
jgi:DNA-binding transcriptional MerR regulator